MVPFKNNPRRKGQNITEYLVLVAGVLVVVILAVNSRGIFTQAVNRSIEVMFNGVEDMATVQCLGTIDDVSGRWSGWGAWAGCGWNTSAGTCLEYSTHTCNNPSPKCGGTECRLEITAGSTTSLNRTETKSQACYVGSWQVGVCAPDSCTGACGSTVGKCTTGNPKCDTGCCNPAGKPATRIACIKKAYPDEWPDPPFGACDKTCDAGISSRSVLCPGMCCDADIKPPTRRACTDGCCAASLYAYTDVGDLPGPADDTLVTASFGPKANGWTSSPITCPAGYTGNPTRTCKATADEANCTGNDKYSPPASCYNIRWSDPVSDTCLPANCDPVTADVGYGSYTLDYTFPGRLHGATASVNCATLSQGGVGHTGTSSYECWLGAWRNLNAACIPNCSQQTLDVGAGQTGLFPETVDAATAASVCPCGYQGNPQRQCDEVGNNLGEWGNLIAGTECALRSCPAEWFAVAVDDAGKTVGGIFGVPPPPDPATYHGQTDTLDCTTEVDSRFKGSASMDCDWCANTLNGWTNPQYSCIPRHCEAITDNSVDMGAGVKGNLPLGDHNNEQTLSCANYDPLFAGESKYKCVYGEWTPLSLGCGAADCVDWTTNIGGTVSGTFTGGAGSHGVTRDLTCSTINSYYQGTASSTCCYGDWYAGGTNCASVTTPSGTNVYSPNPACVAYQCTGTEPSGNMSMCSGDDTGLTATDVTGWSVVNNTSVDSNAGCSSKKCEYKCNATFKKFGNACVDTVCNGSNPDPNMYAVACGTQKPLVDTDCWLNSSTCSTNTMCEYYCDNNTGDYYCSSGPKCYKPKTCASYTGLYAGSSTDYDVTQDDGCGKTLYCKYYCGNGTIDNGEACDKNGPKFNASTDTCAEVDSSYGGGTLGCGSDCTAFDTSQCCVPVDGTWGVPWTTWSDSAGFPDGSGGTCSKACDTGTQSRTGTCNGESCGGSCPAGGDIDTQNCNIQACCVPKTCTELGCGSHDDGCGTTIDCGACSTGVWSVTSKTGLYCASSSASGDITGQSCSPLGSTASRRWFYNASSGYCYDMNYECQTGLDWRLFGMFCGRSFGCTGCLPVGTSCTTAGEMCCAGLSSLAGCSGIGGLVFRCQ